MQRACKLGTDQLHIVEFIDSLDEPFRRILKRLYTSREARKHGQQAVKGLSGCARWSAVEHSRVSGGLATMPQR